jgi:predicted MFS family arabinose efflux permease
MLAAGGSAGAILAAPTSDFIGRKWSVFGWGLVFVIGAAMQMVANYEVLLGGRGCILNAHSSIPSGELSQIRSRIDDRNVQSDDCNIAHAGFLG